MLDNLNSIAKSIIDNHGCEIGFENKNDGVVFYFTMEKSDTERNSNEN